MPQYPSSANYVSAKYTASSTSTSGSYALFDTTTKGGTTSIVDNNLVEYDSTNGRFTVIEPGIYNVIICINIITASGTPGILTLDLQVNGVSLGTIGIGVHSSVDPVERTLIRSVELEANDYVTIVGTGSSSGTIAFQLTAGTCFNMWKID